MQKMIFQAATPCRRIYVDCFRKKVDAEQKQIEDRNHISIMFRLMFSDSDPTFQEMLVFIAGQTGMPLAPRKTSEESRN